MLEHSAHYHIFKVLLWLMNLLKSMRIWKLSTGSSDRSTNFTIFDIEYPLIIPNDISTFSPNSLTGQLVL